MGVTHEAWSGVPVGTEDADQIARLFELSRDLFATTDGTGRFTELNPRLGGRPGVVARGADGSAGGRARSSGRRRADRRRHRRGNGAGFGIEAFENRYRCKDGPYRWLQWNARRWGDSWYAVARDVTDRNRLEQQALRDPLTLRTGTAAC